MEFPKPLVSPAWLAEQLNPPNIVIVDCRFSLTQPALGRQQYQEGHLPGAVYLDLNQDLASPVQAHGGRHPLPDVDVFCQTLSKIGVTSGQTFVVAYDDSRFAFASRLWWLLNYLGHDRVALLDGGFSYWQNQGYPVTADLTTPKPGEFTPQIQSEKLVDIATVKAEKERSSVVLVDSRDPERYLGKHEPIDPIAGHIPGAVNFPWKQVTNHAGLANATQQQQRWQDLASAESIMVYCGSGVTACVNLWSLALAGIQMGKLYAGSWSDWCSYPENFQ
ncbi:MAG: sulfurtransferase [Microcoleaceae cyanobacterium]